MALFLVFAVFVILALSNASPLHKQRPLATIQNKHFGFDSLLFAFMIGTYHALILKDVVNHRNQNVLRFQVAMDQTGESSVWGHVIGFQVAYGGSRITSASLWYVNELLFSLCFHKKLGQYLDENQLEDLVENYVNHRLNLYTDTKCIQSMQFKLALHYVYPNH